MSYNWPSDTSSSLLLRVKQHEQEAWVRFTRIYGPLVYRWCRHDAGLQPADAADLLQEVFRAVAVGIPGYRSDRPGDNFRGWLRTITRNKVRDFQRRQRMEPVASGGSTAHRRFLDLEDPIADEAQAASETDKAVVVQRTLDVIKDDFEERTWQAFWRSAIEGHPTPEIAQALGLTDYAVRQACYRVRRRLREELHALWDG